MYLSQLGVTSTIQGVPLEFGHFAKLDHSLYVCNVYKCNFCDSLPTPLRSKSKHNITIWIKQKSTENARKLLPCTDLGPVRARINNRNKKIFWALVRHHTYPICEIWHH